MKVPMFPIWNSYGVCPKKISAATLDKLPYNVEKNQKEKSKQQKDFMCSFRYRKIQNARDIYKCYKELPNLSKATVLQFDKACKDIPYEIDGDMVTAYGATINYPIYFATQLVSIGKTYKEYGDKYHNIKIKAYRINKTGVVESIIFNIKVNIRTNEPEYGHTSLGGIYLYR